MRKKTTIKQEYQKQLKRIKKIYAEETAAGVYFPKTFVPKEVKNPTRKHLEKLKKINRWSIYRDFYAERVDPVSGEKAIGRAARKEAAAVQKLEKIERKRKKGVKVLTELDVLIERVNSMLERLRNELYGYNPPEYWSNALAITHAMAVKELLSSIEYTQLKITSDFNFAYAVAQSFAENFAKAAGDRNGWIYTVMYDSDEMATQTALNKLYDMVAPVIKGATNKSFNELIDDLTMGDYEVTD